MDILLIKKEAKEEIDRAIDYKSLEDVFKKYLGRKGKITRFFHNLKNLPPEERAEKGRQGNELKGWLIKYLEEKKKLLKKEERKEGKKVGLDITQPGEKVKRGHISLISKVLEETEDFFASMGFAIVEGPEIETEFYNFDALNVPRDHPARDQWDTFWIEERQKSKEKLLLRTHTSPIQIRYMQKHRPPFRIIGPGRCFRHEATDASHEIQFYHLEGLAVGRDISLANLKWTLESFIRYFFGKEVKIGWQPSYFPFVEPGLQLLIQCDICHGKGCSTCGGTGWLEVLGCGMVHPKVFKNVGINPKIWQGFAFGIGIDRLVMIRYRINDIRWFHSGDLRFIRQF